MTTFRDYVGGLQNANRANRARRAAGGAAFNTDFTDSTDYTNESVLTEKELECVAGGKKVKLTKEDIDVDADGNIIVNVPVDSQSGFMILQSGVASCMSASTTIPPCARSAR